ncbi:O-antigen ligase family protein [Serratia fonticola]|uniref:O-antigen ligase family protein n=1 Tax=Serratia fonticola TaxID=47917 RepID=UPI003AAD3619
MFNKKNVFEDKVELYPKVSMVEQLFIALFILSLVMSSISIFPFGISKFGDSGGVKLYHILSFLLFGFLFLKFKKIAGFSSLFFIFILYILVYSLMCALLYEMDIMMANYIYCAFIFYLGTWISSLISTSKLTALLSKIAIAFSLIVIFKIFIFKSVIIAFLASPWGHPMLPSISGGGLNIESSWLAMMTIFGYKNKKVYFPLLIVAFIVSLLYASRAGTLICVYSYLAYLFLNVQNKNKIVGIISIFALLCIAIGFVFYLSTKDLYVVERFTSVGDDPGSLGRLALWKWIIPAFLNNPLGYGPGNAIKAVTDISQTTFIENNVHLYPAQILLDFGLIGFIVYIFIVIKIFRGSFSRNLGVRVFYIFLLSYILLGLIQFRGADPLPFLLAGFVFSKKNKWSEE